MGKILQLTDADKERLLEEFPYLDAPDVGIPIGLDSIKQIESPFNFDLFNTYISDLRYAVIGILSNPRSVWLTVKLLLGITLEPMQAVILAEMWDKPYPLLCGSRGFSKCITGDSWIIKDDGFARIGDVVGSDLPPMVRDYRSDLNLLGENGFNQVEYCWSNGFSDTIKMKTSCGYQLEGTYNHPIRVVRDGEIAWVNMEDLKLGDYVPIHRSTEWFPNTNNITVDEGYLMGLLVGDGGYTVRGRISFTTADTELAWEVSRISNNLWGKQFKKQKGQKYTYNLWGVAIWDELFQKYGFNSSVCGEKDIPSSILSAKKEVVAAFIRGLADTDGCFNKSMSSVQFAAKSENLMRSLQFLLTRFGIISTLTKKRNKKYNRDYYYLNIFGENNKIFQREIGFGLSRKQSKLDAYCLKNSNPNKDVLPHDLVLKNLLSLREKLFASGPFGKRGYNYERNLLSPYRLKKYQSGYETIHKILKITDILRNEPEWIFLNDIVNKNYFYDKVTSLESSESITYDVHIPNDHSFISNGFISHNSFLLAVYIILKCVFNPGVRVVVIGFGLRQARNLYNYVEKMWRNAPLLREMVKSDQRSGPAQKVDRYIFVFGESQASFLPIGSSGATIRGERASVIIIDEYGDVPKVIVDTVVVGFAAVSEDPIEKRNLIARIKRLKSQGKWDSNREYELKNILKANQIIYSGTAKFHFNHFAQDWLRYKEIIKAGHDVEKLKLICNEDDPNKLPNPDHFSIMRIPYDIIPEGMMDVGTIHKIKQSSSKAVFEQEYGAVFTDDSDGFFKAKLLYQCTANDTIEWGGIKITDAFDPYLKPVPGKKYLLAFDPAAEVDNAAIVILELNGTHCKVVYCWTINKKEYEAEIMQLVGGMTYYKFCAWKICQLHKKFSFDVISIDAQGGGVAVAEILERDQEIRPGLPPILPIRDGHILWDGKDKPTDDIEGQHIVELVQFANAKWNSEAHHGLRSDLENRKVIFPRFDALSVDIDEDAKIDRLNESLADISNEIEQLKYELTIIEHTITPGGNRERWDTPEVKHDNDKKGHLRNDRASALVMANMAARRIRLAYPEVDYFSEFTNKPRKIDGPWKAAPGWFKEKNNGGIGVFKIL